MFGLVLSFVASLFFGVAPAVFAAGSYVQTTLQESAAQSSEPRARRLARNVLATAEIALAVVLLIAAGLLLRRFDMLTSVNPGFEPEQIVKADIQLPRFQYSKPEQWAAFSDELLRRLRSQPGMSDSAIGIPLPLNAQGFVNLPFDIVGRAPSPKGTPENAHFVSVSPAYFHVMGIPVVRGRSFTDQDASSAPRVTMISEAFAHQFFPDEDPVGQQLVFSFRPDPPVARQIVGIVGDVRDASMGQDPGPMMYVPFPQSPIWGAEVVVRSKLALESIAATIRRQTHEIDKDLPVADVVAMSELINTSEAQPRFRTWLLGSFALTALLLAAAGIFGVISYSVSRRTHDIGIRIALGASPGNVMRLVITEAALVAVAGLAVGIPAALAAGHLLSNFLFHVHPTRC